MAVALEQFMKQLADSGVIAPGKLENFVPPKAHPKDAQELARQLVQSKQLTKYQAQEIYQGRAKSLILGNYTIVDKIGAGGMGQVFKAEHRRMHRLVAIKMLPKNVMQDPATIARFQREVEAAAKLGHPNIVAAHDADEANGIHFLAMEYVEGSDLSALVKKNGPFTVDKAVNYILQAARGLEFAHGEGVVHRDIKPANLLLDKKGTVKILDMSLARISSGDDDGTQAELTGTGAVLGTVDYMAPEQALSTKHADARADIYSLGCSLHYLVTGKAAYDGDTLMAKLLAHRDKPIPSLGSEVPERIQSVFRKMVAKKIEDRYQTMSEVVAALQECVVATSTSGPPQPTSESSSADSNLSFLADATAHAQHHGQTKQAKQLQKEAKPAKKASGWNRKKLLLVGGAIGAGLLAAAILAAVVFKLRTKDGTLVVEVNQPDAVVQVDGNVEITQPGVKGAITISVDPGKHRLKVEKDGFEFFAQDFEIESGGSATIKATLVEDKPWLKPAFLEWQKGVAAMPAEKQIDAVAKKLQDLNPGFDGNEKHKIEKRVVTELQFDTKTVTDISPVRALAGLRNLSCGGGWSTLSDLSPLQGMHLTGLACDGTRVSDLSPLSGMKLTYLFCHNTRVADLSPLKGMPLTTLACNNTKVDDLSPLKGMPLTDLSCWVTPVSDLSPLNGMELTQLLCENTRVADLSPLKGMPLTILACNNTNVSDLSPLKGMRLTHLVCNCTKVSDLSPLEGMPLTNLNCYQTNISDLSPLKGIPLTSMEFDGTQVSDLSPLKGMPLTSVICNGTSVSDLSPLKGMNLTHLRLNNTKVSDLSPLEGMSVFEICLTPKHITKGLDVIRQMQSLKKIGIDWLQEIPPAEFWKKYDAGEYGKPAAAAKSTLNDPAFQQWMKDVAALFAEPQAKAVAKKLQELNPGFDGKETHKIEKGVVTELQFNTKNVTDISPVRALAGLRVLTCGGSARTLSDLSPLKGMHLTALVCNVSGVTDLSPLEGMPLTDLGIWDTPVSDLSPLNGTKLTHLLCYRTRVSDLSPLKGVPLESLNCCDTKVDDLSSLEGMHLTEFFCLGTGVSDLSPLTGMRLTLLSCANTKVSDLSPLKGMPLAWLDCSKTPITDLSPLEGMNLADLVFTPSNITKGLGVVRQMKSLAKIGIFRNNTLPAVEFWKKYDAGEFGK